MTALSRDALRAAHNARRQFQTGSLVQRPPYSPMDKYPARQTTLAIRIPPRSKYFSLPRVVP